MLYPFLLRVSLNLSSFFPASNLVLLYVYSRVIVVGVSAFHSTSILYLTSSFDRSSLWWAVILWFKSLEEKRGVSTHFMSGLLSLGLVVYLYTHLVCA